MVAPAVSATIGTATPASRIARVAARPSRFGICMSISTHAKGSPFSAAAVTAATACAPSSTVSTSAPARLRICSVTNRTSRASSATSTRQEMSASRRFRTSRTWTSSGVAEISVGSVTPTGSRSVKVLPSPSTLSRSMAPPRRFASRSLIARPSPVPCTSGMPVVSWTCEKDLKS